MRKRNEPSIISRRIAERIVSMGFELEVVSDKVRVIEPSQCVIRSNGRRCSESRSIGCWSWELMFFDGRILLPIFGGIGSIFTATELLKHKNWDICFYDNVGHEIYPIKEIKDDE